MFTQLIEEHVPSARTILVAGCGGKGAEVRSLAEDNSRFVVGFDINLEPQLEGASGSNWQLIKASVLDIPFKNDTFDAILYYHVIEHVPAPEQSLAELSRVLRREGGIFVGTPNRSRLLWYIDSRSSLLEKIRWNWVEWKYRLRGKFRNEFGAHAGFTERELHQLMAPYFREIHQITERYLRSKFAKRLPPSILSFVCWKPIRQIVAPSIYAWAKK